MSDATQGNNVPANLPDVLDATTREELIGERLTQPSSRIASQWLLNKAALYGLATAEMVGLTLSAFMAMEMHPTQSMSAQMRTLTPIFESLQHSGVTASERAEIIAGIANALQSEYTWHVQRDNRGRSYLRADPR